MYLLLQNVSFADDSGDAMSFDECLQLLAETFPVEEPEVRALYSQPSGIKPASFKMYKIGHIFVFVQQNPSACLDTNVATMMSPEQPALPSATLSPGPLSPPTQTVSPDWEQTWMEILSLPELQVKNDLLWYLSEQFAQRMYQ